ncbi:MAG: hypothetical protein AMXMBFR7_32870 [Planctomycetota bacterium]
MSRAFTRTSEHRLTANGTGMSWALPFTLFGWFRSASATVDGRIMSIGTATSVTDQGSLSAKGDTGGDPVSALAYSTEVAANSSTGYSVNTWHSACGLFRSATDRAALIDGGSEGTNSSSRTPQGSDLLIGARHANTGTAADHFDGQLAHLAIYNDDLVANEAQALAKGVPPTRVARLNLKNYWPLYGFQSPEQDFTASKVNPTLTNTPGTSDLMPPVAPLRTRRAAA